ncbi:hypothetical protein GCM10023153_29940 [Ornithinibacter aureus]|uniref:Lipoprotein n=1 Tax=Ornithinibacter aureus TaxID=622664 RepID=A0ABP8K828_9MICO|nr:hypothetical protein [Ornithinibacter aureus]KAF0834937.1 hypothetical protein C8E84_2791 [Ornithinibacter aureus]
MTTRAAHALRATALLAAGLLLSGCAVFSPTQTDYDYPASDGVALSIPGLELRNLAFVVENRGGPAVLIGQAVNNATSAVDVTFGVEGASSTETAAVPAFSGKSLSEPGALIEFDSLPANPGDTITLTVSTPEAGQNVVTVPVLSGVDHNATIFG